MTGGECLLTVNEVAELAHLSAKAVYRAIGDGELPAAKLRGRLRIRHCDFDAWVAANMIKPDASPLEQVTELVPRQSGSGGLSRLVASGRAGGERTT